MDTKFYLLQPIVEKYKHFKNMLDFPLNKFSADIKELRVVVVAL
jgi:hypothetical protein